MAELPRQGQGGDLPWRRHRPMPTDPKDLENRHLGLIAKKTPATLISIILHVELWRTDSGALEPPDPAVRILVATPFLPHADASHGGGVYLHALVAALAARATVDLVSFATQAELRNRPPLPSDLASVRLIERAEIRELGGAARLRQKGIMLRRWAHGRLPVVVAKFRSRAMARALRAATRDARASPDAALVEMDLMAQYLPCIGAVPSILTDHEAGHPVPAAIGPYGFGLRRDARLWESYVERTYRRADRIQALTTEDAEALTQRFGRTIHVRPPLVDLPTRAVEPGKAPPRILFLGDYRHAPNPEAAREVALQVLPRIREQLPDAELWLAGPNPTPFVAALAQAPGVRVQGFVKDLGSLFGQVRALVAPVFSGGGSRIKVLTALAHGLPVISNDLGLRGVHADAPAIHRGESPQQLCAAVLPLLESASRAATAGRAARTWAEENLAAERVAADQLAAIEELRAERRD
jgi:glycosyltransferase involved in cell wall biosynthesis